MSVSFKVTVKSGSDFKSDALNYRVRFLASEKIIFWAIYIAVLSASVQQKFGVLSASVQQKFGVCERRVGDATVSYFPLSDNYSRLGA